MIAAIYARKSTEQTTVADEQKSVVIRAIVAPRPAPARVARARPVPAPPPGPCRAAAIA